MNNIVQGTELLSLFFCKIQLMLNKIWPGSSPLLYGELFLKLLPTYLGFEILTSYLRWHEILTTAFFLLQTEGNHSFVTTGNTPCNGWGLKWWPSMHISYIALTFLHVIQSFAIAFLESVALQKVLSSLLNIGSYIFQHSQNFLFLII